MRNVCSAELTRGELQRIASASTLHLRGRALGLAQVRNAQGELVEAERIARQIFEWGPSHAWMPSWRAAMLIAGVHFERKDYQGSEDWLQRCGISVGGEQ